MYRIGEFSKLTGLSDKTLRYYESIGLLIPDEVDNWTNYRLYSDANVEEAFCILNLKELGFSLNDIINMKSGLDESVIDNQINSLEEQKNIIDYQLFRLFALKKQISNTEEKVIPFNNTLTKKLNNTQKAG